MADDRLWLEHVCGEGIFIGKLYAGEPACRNENLGDDLDAFLDHHLKKCLEGEWNGRDFSQGLFALKCESDGWPKSTWKGTDG